MSSIRAIADLVVGGDHTCVRLVANSSAELVSCWGVGEDGRLGNGDEDDIGDDELPNSVGFVSY